MLAWLPYGVRKTDEEFTRRRNCLSVRRPTCSVTARSLGRSDWIYHSLSTHTNTQALSDTAHLARCRVLPPQCQTQLTSLAASLSAGCCHCSVRQSSPRSVPHSVQGAATWHCQTQLTSLGAGCCHLSVRHSSPRSVQGAATWRIECYHLTATGCLLWQFNDNWYDWVVVMLLW